jgi:hypothetical protein
MNGDSSVLTDIIVQLLQFAEVTPDTLDAVQGHRLHKVLLVLLNIMGTAGRHLLVRAVAVLLVVAAGGMLVTAAPHVNRHQAGHLQNSQQDRREVRRRVSAGSELPATVAVQ